MFKTSLAAGHLRAVNLNPSPKYKSGQALYRPDADGVFQPFPETNHPHCTLH